MLLAVNGINAGIGFIARDLTNALVAKQQDGFYRILIIYACCFVVASDQGHAAVCDGEVGLDLAQLVIPQLDCRLHEQSRLLRSESQ